MAKRLRNIADLISEALTGKIFKNEYGEYKVDRVYNEEEIRVDISYLTGEGRRGAPCVPIEDMGADQLIRDPADKQPFPGPRG